VNSILSTAPHFDSPHNKALLCVTSLAGILSVVGHFSNISVTQSKAWKTAKVQDYMPYVLICSLQITCLPNCPDYNYDTLHHNYVSYNKVHV